MAAEGTQKERAKTSVVKAATVPVRRLAMLQTLEGGAR